MSGEMKYNYIAIEGNIGAGKTSLAKMIAGEYNARLILERFADNSFLPKFYKDPGKYAFPLEMSFLADRYQQLKDELSRSDMFKSFIVADYFIDKSLIFARKTLQNDEYALYSRLFGIINSALPKPDLILYLYNNVKQLKQNILTRGRDYEKEIEYAYLEKIQSGYLEYFKTLKGFKIVIVETVSLDFVHSRNDYARLKKLLTSDYSEGIHTIIF